MTEPQPVRPKQWRAALLSAVRTAAILAVATGVAGMITSQWPALDERWIYVAAVAVIGALEGVAIGIASAAAAVVCQQLMATGTFAVTPADGLLFGGCAAAALVARGITTARRRRTQQAATAYLPMLGGTSTEGPEEQRAPETFEPHPADAPDLRELKRDVPESPNTRLFELEAVARSAAASDPALRELLRDDESSPLQEALVRERQHSERLAAQLLEAEEARRSAEQTTSSQTSRLQKLAGDLAAAQVDVATLAERVSDAESSREVAERRAEELEAELRRVRQNVGELQQRASTAQQQIAATATANAAAADAAARAVELQAANAELHDRLAGTERDLEALRAQLQEAESRRTAEAQSASAELQDRLSTRERELEEVRAQLQKAEAARAAFEKDAAAARDDLARARADAATAAGRVRQQELSSGAADSERVRLQTALANSQAVVDELNRRLRETETHRQEIDDERNRLTRELESSRTSLATHVEELQTLRLAAQNERDKSEQELSRASLESARLAARVDELEARRQADSEAHEAQRAEIDAKLRAATGDVDRLLGRFAELEALHASAGQKLADADSRRAAAEQRVAELEALQTTGEQHAAEIEAVRASAAQRLAEVESEWRARVEELSTTLTSVRQQLDDTTASARSAAEHAAELHVQRAETEQALQRSETELRSQIETLRSNLALATERAGEVTAERDRLQGALAASEQAWQEKLSRSAMEMSARFDAELRTARSDGELLRSRTAELEQVVTALREQQAKADAEWTDRLDETVTRISGEYDLALGQAARERDEARADASAAFERVRKVEQELADAGERTGALQRENRALRAAAEQDAARLAEETAQRARLDQEWNEKLQTIVAHLASDHEADMGDALVAKEEARAEARKLTKQVHALEASLRDLTAARDALIRENADLRAANEQNRGQGLDETVLRQKIDAEWSDKLQTIVAHLASDHETDMGDALVAKEEARAEARKLTKQVQTLEASLRDLSFAHDALRSENAALRTAGPQTSSAPIDETALRQKIESEWSEKLQTIVTHLASDHESDMGQAMLEKEEARAEARSLSMKVQSLTKALETERQGFRDAAQKWIAERQALLRRIEGVQPPSARPAELAAAAAARRNGQPVVLIVHRDAALRTVASHSLQQSGYSVITAADGLEAFRIALTHAPDVILAESQMPKMDARELVQLLKSRVETSRVKIVIIGNQMRSDPAAPFRPDEFLRDPANLESLKATLEQVLAGA